MSDYRPVYEDDFVQNLHRYGSIRVQIQRRVERILANPYANTERLDHIPGRLNLRGCRSARVDRNFRIVFVICEECRRMVECEYCLCEGFEDQTIVFLTVGPHDRAYSME